MALCFSEDGKSGITLYGSIILKKKLTYSFIFRFVGMMMVVDIFNRAFVNGEWQKQKT